MSRIILTALMMGFVACGTGVGNPAGSPLVGETFTSVIITSDGLSVVDLTVSMEEGFAFVNGDSVNHQIDSECNEFDTALLEPGQSMTVSAGSEAKVCAYHDALAPEDVRYQGTITIVTSGG